MPLTDWSFVFIISPLSFPEKKRRTPTCKDNCRFLRLVIVFLRKPAFNVVVKFSCSNDGKLRHRVGTVDSISYISQTLMESRSRAMNMNWWFQNNKNHTLSMMLVNGSSFSKYHSANACKNYETMNANCKCSPSFIERNSEKDL